MNNIKIYLSICLCWIIIFGKLNHLNAQNINDSPSDTALVDSTQPKPKKGQVYPYMPIYRISLDVAKITQSIFNNKQLDIEGAFEFGKTNTSFWTVESGYGRGKVDNSVLNYEAKNVFLKLGMDKSLVSKMTKNDHDIAFMGFRLAAAKGSLSEGSYTITNPFGGTATSTFDGKNYNSFWGEITAGIKVQLTSHIFAGWTGRAKFMLKSGFNSQEVQPSLIAGYGSGSKSTAFDFNAYISYAIFGKAHSINSELKK